MFKKILALFLCFQLMVVSTVYAQANQVELDNDKEAISPGGRAFLDLTVFAIALFAADASKFIPVKYMKGFDGQKIESKVTERFTYSKIIFRWSGLIYFTLSMVMAAMKLFWFTKIDEDVSHVSMDLSNPDHVLSKGEKESYIGKVEKYIKNKEQAILYVRFKMYLTYAVAAGWAIATVVAFCEALTPMPALNFNNSDIFKRVTQNNPTGNLLNTFVQFLVTSSFAKNLEETQSKNTSPDVQQVLILLLGTAALVLECLTSITAKWGIEEQYPATRIGIYGVSSTLAVFDAENFRSQLEKLSREKETLNTTLDTINKKLIDTDANNSQASAGLATNKLIDANTVFSSNKGMLLPDCTVNASTNPSCPKKTNLNVSDTPPQLEELAKSGMNIGVAQNLFGNLATASSATKAGNYNAGLSTILNSGAKNALNNSLKTLKKVAANYAKIAPTEEGKKFDFKAKTTEEMKKLAGIYNKVVNANKGSLAKMDSFSKGFDPIISEAAIEKMSDKAVNLDSLVKLDEKEKVLDKPKAAFTVNHAASDEDAKKEEIMNLFSGTGEEEATPEDANTAVKVVPENQESPDLTSSEIINDSSKNLFKLLSVRYFKTVYPLVLDSESVVEIKPHSAPAVPLAPSENNRLPASE